MLIGNIGAFLLAPLMMFPSFGNGNFSAAADSSRIMAQAEVETSADNDRWWNNRPDRPERPEIDEIDPEEGLAGSQVTITGENLTDDTRVWFNRSQVEDIKVDEENDTLSFTIPEEIDGHCWWWQRNCEDQEVDPGQYSIKVQNGYLTSNTVQFEVLADEDGNNNNDDEESAEPLMIDEVSGPTSLLVGEEGEWTVAVTSTSTDNLMYSVKWGDEPVGLFSLFRSDDTGYQSSATFTHTYNEDGSFEPEFTVKDEAGNEVSASVEVTVSDPENDVPALTDLDPDAANPGEEVTITGTGFDDNARVRLGENRVRDIEVNSSTSITFTVPELEAGEYRLWVRDDDGRSNAMSFTVLKEDNDEETGHVSVSGISAPTTLETGEEGTWKVFADSSLEGNLRYSVVWGDEDKSLMRRSSIADATVSSTGTFTHTYQTEGDYEPRFTVTDEAGNSASASASVVVTESESE